MALEDGRAGMYGVLYGDPGQKYSDSLMYLSQYVAYVATVFMVLYTV